jgi:hypothetical protein
MFTKKDFDHGFPEGPEPQDLADWANEKIQPFLEEFQRLQELCKMQEQYGTGFALEVAEENQKLRAALKILQRYHGGDGSVTREIVMDALTCLL